MCACVPSPTFIVQIYCPLIPRRSNADQGPEPQWPSVILMSVKCDVRVDPGAHQLILHAQLIEDSGSLLNWGWWVECVVGDVYTSMNQLISENLRLDTLFHASSATYHVRARF